MKCQQIDCTQNLINIVHSQPHSMAPLSLLSLGWCESKSCWKQNKLDIEDGHYL